MKKETLSSIGLLVLGLFFEYLHFMTDSALFGLKFYMLGIICLVLGTIGSWIYIVIPLINDKLIK